MKYTEVLTERYINVFDADKKQTYAGQVLGLIDNAYRDVGGHINYQTVDDLIYNSNFWKLVSRNGKIICAIVYKDRQGRKLVAVGHDGTYVSKQSLRLIIAEDIVKLRMWAEVSGDFGNWCIKQGLPPVTNDQAEELTGKQVLDYIGPFKYVRNIASVPVVKMIVGYPNGKSYELPAEYKKEDISF